MFVFFQAEDGIRDLVRSRGLGDVYKRQGLGQPLLGRLLRYDLRDMTFDKLQIERLPDCPILSLIHI